MNKTRLYKANKLVEAAYATHSVHEQLLILACLGIADPKTLTATTKVRLTVQRFADIADLNPLGAYDDLQRAASRLVDRTLTIANPDPDNPRLLKTKTNWVQHVDYEDGAITLMFTYKIIPYLAQLERCFTSYNLRQVSGFKSFYSHRVYELLVQFPKKRERVIPVAWLREHFQLKDSYPRILDLKKWVIDPAVKDINEFTDLIVSYSQRKRGKTIEAFVFEYARATRQGTGGPGGGEAGGEVGGPRLAQGRAPGGGARPARVARPGKDRGHYCIVLYDTTYYNIQISTICGRLRSPCTWAVGRNAGGQAGRYSGATARSLGARGAPLGLCNVIPAAALGPDAPGSPPEPASCCLRRAAAGGAASTLPAPYRPPPWDGLETVPATLSPSRSVATAGGGLLVLSSALGPLRLRGVCW